MSYLQVPAVGNKAFKVHTEVLLISSAVRNSYSNPCRETKPQCKRFCQGVGKLQKLWQKNCRFACYGWWQTKQFCFEFEQEVETSEVTQSKAVVENSEELQWWNEGGREVSNLPGKRNSPTQLQAIIIKKYMCTAYLLQISHKKLCVMLWGGWEEMWNIQVILLWVKKRNKTKQTTNRKLSLPLFCYSADLKHSGLRPWITVLRGMQSSFGCSPSTPALQSQLKLSPPIAACCCSAATSRSRSTDGLAASKMWSLQSPLRLFPVLSPFHTVSMERVEWTRLLPTVLSSAHWGWKQKAKLYKYQEWKKWWQGWKEGWIGALWNMVLLC